jgi:hypothetical protein
VAAAIARVSEAPGPVRYVEIDRELAELDAELGAI